MRDYTQEHFDSDILYIEVMNDRESYKKLMVIVQEIKKAMTNKEYFNRTPGFLEYTAKEILRSKISDIVTCYINKNFETKPYSYTSDASEAIFNYFIKEIELGNF